MFFKKPLEQSNQIVDQIVQSTDHALSSGRHKSNDAFDSMGDSIRDLGQRAAPLLSRASEQVSALAQRGVDGARDTSQQLRRHAQRASDQTVNYIKDEPVKAILIAAATTAALVALVSLLRRSRH